MNTLITRETILDLLGKTTGPVASFFVPSGHSASQAVEGRLTLKNLVREAETQLKNSDISDAKARVILAPVTALDADDSFWKSISVAEGGIALFAAAGSFRYYNVPLPLTAQVVVGAEAYTKPLLPLLATPAHFYITVLSKSRPRLYRASEYNVVEISLPDMPEGFTDSEALLSQQKEISFHSSGANRNSGARGIGQPGGAEDSSKVQLEQYIKDIAHAVDKKVSTDGGRMVLAGVDYLVGMYRAHSKYKHISKVAITGSQDRESAISLRDEALKILAKSGNDENTGRHHGSTTASALSDLKQLIGTGKASLDPVEIIQAAHDGRVQALLIAGDRQNWGFYEPEARSVVFFDNQQMNAVEINNLAAMQTLRHNGEIFVTSAALLPSGGSIGAIYRY